MALINCEECNAEISDKAKACPKCGNPMEKQEAKVNPCPQCDFELEKGAIACLNCQNKLVIKDTKTGKYRQAYNWEIKTHYDSKRISKDSASTPHPVSTGQEPNRTQPNDNKIKPPVGNKSIGSFTHKIPKELAAIGALLLVGVIGITPFVVKIVKPHKEVSCYKLTHDMDKLKTKEFNDLYSKEKILLKGNATYTSGINSKFHLMVKGHNNSNNCYAHPKGAFKQEVYMGRSVTLKCSKIRKKKDWLDTWPKLDNCTIQNK